MRTFALFSAKKTPDFSKFMVCPVVRTRGWGEGSIFRDFLRTSFMNRPLIDIAIDRLGKVFLDDSFGETDF